MSKIDLYNLQVKQDMLDLEIDKMMQFIRSAPVSDEEKFILLKHFTFGIDYAPLQQPAVYTGFKLDKIVYENYQEFLRVYKLKAFL